jgi:hypothetical protein
LSPLVQVIETPCSVIEHSHLHIARLHWHIIMPFIMQLQLHMPSASILHMCCSIVQATSSSQVQVIFMPPAHFSSFISHRGSMHIEPAMGDIEGIAGMPGDIAPDTAPAAPVNAERSNISILVIANSFRGAASVFKMKPIATKRTDSFALPLANPVGVDA